MRQMFEDGFFKGGMGGERKLGTEKPSATFVNSVYDYMESIGVLQKGQKFLPATENDLLPATKPWPTGELQKLEKGGPPLANEAVPPQLAKSPN